MRYWQIPHHTLILASVFSKKFQKQDFLISSFVWSLTPTALSEILSKNHSNLFFFLDHKYVLQVYLYLKIVLLGLYKAEAKALKNKNICTKYKISFLLNNFLKITRNQSFLRVNHLFSMHINIKKPIIIIFCSSIRPHEIVSFQAKV